MARGRMISTGLGSCRRFGSASERSALLYLLAYPHADRQGRLEGEPFAILSSYVPAFAFLHGWTEATISEDIHDLQRAGLWAQYEDRGHLVIQILRFHQHQTIRWVGSHKERKSRWRGRTGLVDPDKPDVLSDESDATPAATDDNTTGSVYGIAPVATPPGDEGNATDSTHDMSEALQGIVRNVAGGPPTRFDHDSTAMRKQAADDVLAAFGDPRSAENIEQMVTLIAQLTGLRGDCPTIAKMVARFSENRNSFAAAMRVLRRMSGPTGANRVVRNMVPYIRAAWQRELVTVTEDLQDRYLQIKEGAHGGR